MSLLPPTLSLQMQSQSWSSVCIANEEKVRIDPTTRLVSASIPHLVQHNPIFAAPRGCTYTVETNPKQILGSPELAKLL